MNIDFLETGSDAVDAAILRQIRNIVIFAVVFVILKGVGGALASSSSPDFQECQCAIPQKIEAKSPADAIPWVYSSQYKR